jgi:hypothetical protein
MGDQIERELERLHAVLEDALGLVLRSLVRVGLDFDAAIDELLISFLAGLRSFRDNSTFWCRVDTGQRVRGVITSISPTRSITVVTIRPCSL